MIMKKYFLSNGVNILSLKICQSILALLGFIITLNSAHAMSDSNLSTSSGGGGSGVIILSVPTANYSGVTTGSPTITVSGGYRIYTWTSSGSITF